MLFYCEDDWALAQIAHRASFLEDIQKMPGHSAGWPAPGGPA